MKSSPIIEMCVTNLEEAIAAERGGADQIELCVDIAADGLTPPLELTQACIDHLHIHIKVLVRCREGDFTYTQEEKAEMLDAVSLCKSLGIKEVVVGALTENGELDHEFIQDVVDIASPMKVCIHKAIDASSDILASTALLKSMPGITGILTSGGAATALEGADVIRDMIDMVGDRIQILAAGKVTHENLPKIMSLINAPAYHGRRILAL